jgi:hypothetical protein
MRIGIRDPDFFDPRSGIGMEKIGSGIWYKHPGSATLALLAIFLMSSGWDP